MTFEEMLNAMMNGNYIEELSARFDDITEEEKKEIRKYARHYNSGR